VHGYLPPPGRVPEALLDGIAGFLSRRGKSHSLSPTARVLTALRHKEPDRVPTAPVICGAGRQLIGRSYREFSTDAAVAAESFLAGHRYMGGDVIIVLVDLSVEAADFGQAMVYPENSTAHPDYDNPRIRSRDQYRTLGSIDLKHATRMNRYLETLSTIVKRTKLKEGIVSGFVFGPLGVLNMMRDAELLFKDCVNHPLEVMGAMEVITGVLIEFVEAQCDTGVPVVTIDTLFASWNGLSKDLWNRIEAPFVREISRAIHGKGCLCAAHNCGNGPYFDAQIEAMELDVISYAHLPDDCSSLQELKEKYGDRVVLVGQVPTELLASGSWMEVIDECQRQIDILARGGGFILAPGCEYPPNANLLNALALVKAAEIRGA